MLVTFYLEFWEWTEKASLKAQHAKISYLSPQIEAQVRLHWTAAFALPFGPCNCSVLVLPLGKVCLDRREPPEVNKMAPLGWVRVFPRNY